MPTRPTSSEPVRAPSRVFTRVAVTALWTFISVTVIVLTAIGQSIKTGQLDFVARIIWDAGWIGWAPLTFLVLRLTRRYPIESQRRAATVLRLALIGLGVVALQMVLDWLCITALGKLLRNEPPALRTFLFLGVYKSHLYYGVYWMIVGAAHALEYHRRFRESELVSSQLETRLAHAHLDRLKAQLHPHFLFNAHNTIVSLIAKKENEVAIQMLTRLSDLLRISLTRSAQQCVTVREELETLGLYLDIQRERFRDRLTIDVIASAEVDDAEIPHLLLQPLVENAFRHGLENVSEDARLEVSVTREGNELMCRVRDNGPGLDDGHPTAAGARTPGPAGAASTGNGIGLANTQERLRQLYGPAQSLALAAAPGGGCTVTLRFPFRVHSAPRTSSVR